VATNVIVVKQRQATEHDVIVAWSKREKIPNVATNVTIVKKRRANCT
jgi:hypothetical protein